MVTQRSSPPERKGNYALVRPSGTSDWWEINDMDKQYAVVSVQASFPNAEEIVMLAWKKISSETQ